MIHKPAQVDYGLNTRSYQLPWSHIQVRDQTFPRTSSEKKNPVYKGLMPYHDILPHLDDLRLSAAQVLARGYNKLSRFQRLHHTQPHQQHALHAGT